MGLEGFARVNASWVCVFAGDEVGWVEGFAKVSVGPVGWVWVCVGVMGWGDSYRLDLEVSRWVLSLVPHPPLHSTGA